MNLAPLVARNVLRNPLRAVLTTLAVVVLVMLITMIITVLLFLRRAMAEKIADVPVVITERYRIPSRFDRRYMDEIVSSGTALNSQLTSEVPGFRPNQYTEWHFVGFMLDDNDKDSQFFCIATIPEKIPVMIDGLDTYPLEKCELMKKPPRSGLANIGIVIGPDRLKTMKKQVGDVFKARSISHRNATGQRIEMEFEVVAELPGDGRWASGAFMDMAYLNRVLEKEKSPLDGRINLGWLKLDDQVSAANAGGLIEKRITDVKSEVASAAVSRFLEPYKGLLQIFTWGVAPGIGLVMTLIVANSIAITVRERTSEMAVLKVLGFSPNRVMLLVLGEALLLGTVAGLLAAGITFGFINHVKGGIKIPVAFFNVFFIPVHALWWGPGLGAITALLGGLLPAWGARSVKPSEVFAKVT